MKKLFKLIQESLVICLIGSSFIFMVTGAVEIIKFMINLPAII